jgi:hypothetical protein
MIFIETAKAVHIANTPKITRKAYAVFMAVKGLNPHFMSLFTYPYQESNHFNNKSPFVFQIITKNA